MSETTTPNAPEESLSQTPSSEPVQEAPREGGTAETVAEVPPPQPPEPSQPSLTPDWRDKRIATLTGRLRELQEKQRQSVVEPAPAAPPSDQTLIEQRARELSIIQDFNRRCDAAALAGRTQFGEAEFNGRINNLQKLSDPSDPASVQAYNSLLMAALEAGEPDRLLFELGGDMNEAQRILSLSPTKMAVELTKKALKAPVQVSGAAKPITPVGTRSASHEPISPDDPGRSDHLSTAEWMRRRESQLADRRKGA
jgi:hypothetical protein